MKIESILNAQEITELAKERFKEERATDHLEGWFLAKEIMRECDEKFKEEVDSIRISKTLVEISKRIPLWLTDQSCIFSRFIYRILRSGCCIWRH